MEGWKVYMEIQQLREQGFKISQIARKVGVSRTTVYTYLNRTPDDMHIWLASTKERTKKLAPYDNEILSWLKEHQDMSAAQVLDWLREKYGEVDVAESTIRGHVSRLRELHQVPKVMAVRQYEAIPDPPMGQQAQVDFGHTKQKTTKGGEIPLHFISFVLSHSRYKAVIWLDRPFTTKDVVRAHETAFEQFGGMPEELVYDQDALMLVNENAGDCIYTAEFESYRQERKFRVRMCRKADPESKGRIENVIGFVKKSFAAHRVFDNLDKWQEQCQAWLERTGNGNMHNTTKKRPAEVFPVEKNHLRPLPKAIYGFKNDTPSITSTVHKDNTIRYKGNRYSVPLGTYQKGETTKVHLSFGKENLMLADSNGEVIAEHKISTQKGQLIQDRNHRRDRSKGIEAYIESVSKHFQNTEQATAYFGEIRSRFPRYIRDHLQMIAEASQNGKRAGLDQALSLCTQKRLYSGQDFRDVLVHLNQREEIAVTASFETSTTHSTTGQQALGPPEVRDMTTYVEILQGGRSS